MLGHALVHITALLLSWAVCMVHGSDLENLASICIDTPGLELCSASQDEGLELLQVRAKLISKQRKYVDHVPRLSSIQPNFTEIIQAIATSTEAPTTGAQLTGIRQNAVGDLSAFITATVIDVVMILGLILFFTCVRTRYPMVYSYNAIPNEQQQIDAPFIPSTTWFGWVHASWKLTDIELLQFAGLDQAMLIIFSELAMRILAVIGLPMVLIVGTLNAICGGSAAGHDYLSYLGMANVRDDRLWMSFMHAVVVWLVCWTVSHHVFLAQKRFISMRKQWLLEMPAPQKCSVMVEHIPKENCSDENIKSYFNRVFDEDVVETAWVIKKANSILVPMIEDRVAALDNLDQAQFEKDKTGIVPKLQNSSLSSCPEYDSIEYHGAQVKELTQSIETERKNILEAAKDPSKGACCSTAFVTFRNARHAHLATLATYTDDDTEYVVSVPPDPADIIWTDFELHESTRKCKEIFGYAALIGLFWGYLPIVFGISSAAKVSNLVALSSIFKILEPVGTLWDAMVASMALTLFMALLPTIICLICTTFFALKEKAVEQLVIQKYYFWFLVIYVMLVTAVGTSITSTLAHIATEPVSVFSLLAKTLPLSTHFYLNYLPLQWVTLWGSLTRYMNLVRYVLSSAIYDREKAKLKSEPEDQAYYGIGARSARSAFLFCICIVFSTLSPLITWLGFIHFWSARTVYPYLVVFAERKKPQLGGDFWVHQLLHVQKLIFLYITIMAGVLFQCAKSKGPGILVCCSYLFQVWSYNRFQHLRWETLSFEDVTHSHHTKVVPRRSTLPNYVQASFVEGKHM